MTLQNELSAVLNRHSAENDSDTPDFVLAQFLLGCLSSFNQAVVERARCRGDVTPLVKMPSDDTDVGRGEGKCRTCGIEIIHGTCFCGIRGPTSFCSASDIGG